MCANLAHKIIDFRLIRIYQGIRRWIRLTYSDVRTQNRAGSGIYRGPKGKPFQEKRERYYCTYEHKQSAAARKSKTLPPSIAASRQVNQLDHEALNSNFDTDSFAQRHASRDGVAMTRDSSWVAQAERAVVGDPRKFACENQIAEKADRTGQPPCDPYVPPSCQYSE